MTDAALSDLYSKQAGQHAQSGATFITSSSRKLPHALELAIRHQFLIQPIFARSHPASRITDEGLLSCDDRLIQYWYSLRPEKWVLHANESDLVVAELVPDLANFSRAQIKRYVELMEASLHFRVRDKFFAFFRNRQGSAITVHVSGVRLHSGKDPVLIPPSRTSSGEILVYENDDAPLLDIALLATHS